MKKLLIITVLFLICQIGVVSVVEGQNVGINETNPDNSALLEMTSTERGLLVPRMTEIERDAIVSPADGLIIYNYDDTCLNLYTYNTWYNMCCCASSTPSISTIMICGNPTDIVDVVSATGETWMDRDLGASQQATAYNDYLAYGALFQWGRPSDGHECITWTSSSTSDGAEQSNETTTKSATDVPGHGDFIVGSGGNIDWRDPQNDNLWQGASGINNPCPSGYRIATEAEWITETASWSTNDYSGAYASPLKLVVSGVRTYSNGSLIYTGNSGSYWSSTVNGNRSDYLLIQSGGTATPANWRERGIACRCIKD